MRIDIRGIDPASGKPDPHGIPQVACPARREDVNPQFTCLNCPFAASVETHEAVDDWGLAFRMVDAVECAFIGGRGGPRDFAAALPGLAGPCHD